MGQLIGYARVSSSGQSLEVQEEALAAAGCHKVFSEKRSGATRGGREELERALDYARDGDTFIVTRLDRLARDAKDLHKIVQFLTDKGVGFRALQQGEFDTTTSVGKVVLGILALFAEFERDVSRERQRAGIDKAKSEGRYRGRKPVSSPAEVHALKAEGLSNAEIARRLGISRPSVLRALARSA